MKDNALYLEVDEDITSAIDKLKHCGAGSVQIVVPKRSTMFQSIINLKLLKKAAQGSGKDLILVTSDRVASDLAARVGLAVAPSIGAKPVFTEVVVPEALKIHEEIIDADDPEPPADVVDTPVKPFRRPLLKRVPITDEPISAIPSAGVVAVPVTDLATEASAGELSDTSQRFAPTNKPLNVPNFTRLRSRVMWVGLAALLVVGYFAAMYAFTSAKVTLYATGTRVNIDTTFSADPSFKSTDQSKQVLAAQTISVTKDISGPFVPTGKKDVGTKAGGTITVSNSSGVDQALVSGTRFAAPDGKIFRSSADIAVPAAKLNAGGDKVNGTASVPVVADAAGDNYNEASAAYSLPALTNPKITAQGAQMSGGTTKSVTITAQTDIDTAKAALLAKDKDASNRDLQGRLPSGFVALPTSEAIITDSLSSSPAVGAEGETGTIVMKITYTELAVKQSEYRSLIHAQEQKQVGAANQVYDDGLSAAQLSLTGDKEASGRQTFHLTTEAYGGSKLDKPAIASKLKGLRFGDASTAAQGLPGITRADISISPGWVSKMPSRTDKITITIQVAASK